MEYTLRMRRPSVLSGEVLWADVTLLNNGAGPVPVPGPGDPSPFEFHLEPEDHRRSPEYDLSQRQMEISLVNAPNLPLTVRSARDLPPGKSTIRPEEIASYSSEPILAGRYEVRLLQSPHRELLASSNVEVLAPLPTAYAAQSCLMSRQRISAFSQAEDSEWAMLVRQSRTATPRHKAYTRWPQKPGKGATSVAVAVNAVTLKPEPRWFAWIEGSELIVRSLWGEVQPVRANPASIANVNSTSLDELQSPALLETGFNIEPRHTFFLVIGSKSPSTHVLRKYEVVERVLRLAWEAPYPAPRAARTLVRYHENQITLVSAGSTDFSLEVLRYSSGGTPGEIKHLSFGRPVATFDLAATTADSVLLRADEPLHVLLQPDSQSLLQYRRFNESLSGELEPLEFLAPAMKASEYRISTGPLLGVLARAGQLILFLKARVKSWTAVADRSTAAAGMQLYTLDGHEYYAEWLDPEQGIRLRRLTGT